jgi:hypothetical protein
MNAFCVDIKSLIKVATPSVGSTKPNNSECKMKIITAESFNSVHMLIFYIVMNSLYRVNQVKASVTVGSIGASSNGK